MKYILKLKITKEKLDYLKNNSSGVLLNLVYNKLWKPPCDICFTTYCGTYTRRELVHSCTCASKLHP